MEKMRWNMEAVSVTGSSQLPVGSGAFRSEMPGTAGAEDRHARRDRQRKKSCTEYGFGTHFHSFQGYRAKRCAEHAAFDVLLLEFYGLNTRFDTVPA